MDTDSELKASVESVRRHGISVESDRTPMEAAIGLLDDASSRLDGLLREHSERIAPILREEAVEEGGTIARAMDGRALCSERVRQLHFLVDRLEAAGDHLRSLTARVEA